VGKTKEEEAHAMSDDDEVSGGFGWGLLVGAVLGVAAGAYLASGPGRGQVESLRARTIELTGSARRAASDPDSAMRRAIQDGINAARRRREELEWEAGRIQPGVRDGYEARDA
jgi:hypothetical protein